MPPTPTHPHTPPHTSTHLHTALPSWHSPVPCTMHVRPVCLSCSPEFSTPNTLGLAPLPPLSPDSCVFEISAPFVSSVSRPLPLRRPFSLLLLHTAHALPRLGPFAPRSGPRCTLHGSACKHTSPPSISCPSQHLHIPTTTPCSPHRRPQVPHLTSPHILPGHTNIGPCAYPCSGHR